MTCIYFPATLHAKSRKQLFPLPPHAVEQSSFPRNKAWYCQASNVKSGVGQTMAKRISYLQPAIYSTLLLFVWVRALAEVLRESVSIGEPCGWWKGRKGSTVRGWISAPGQATLGILRYHSFRVNTHCTRWVVALTNPTAGFTGKGRQRHGGPAFRLWFR